MAKKRIKKIPSHKKDGKSTNEWDEINRIGASTQAVAIAMNNNATQVTSALRGIVKAHIEKPMNGTSNEELSAILTQATTVTEDLSRYTEEVVEISKTHKDKSGGVRSDDQQLQVLGIATRYSNLSDETVAITSDGLADIVVSVSRIADENPEREINMTALNVIKGAQVEVERIKQEKEGEENE